MGRVLEECKKRDWVIHAEVYLKIQIKIDLWTGWTF
jgi:hypothetical protein